MPKRKIIKIDEEKCNGCGLCIPACHEGALQIVNGKAKLVSETYCDGLGACLGECPEGAISLIDKEVEQCGCPGSKMMDFSDKEETDGDESGKRASQLKQWPIQMHLISPMAPFFSGKDVILAADCVAYSIASFHKDYLKGKSLAIACPKLDEGQDIYVEKIRALIDDAKINTLTVMIMDVPCCMGLLSIAKEGLSKSKRKIPIKLIIIGVQGDVLKEEWISA